MMHQVYDDEMTFKLVAAASSVSGLPVEVCLEEFGKHFLVYCQKNGYDQILRVLGSNLYDFLTNLDNLHDHLASIYPGMRAPSFRVTRHLNRNKLTAPRTSRGDDCNTDNDLQQDKMKRSRETTGGANPMNTTTTTTTSSSMYLHYYSERAGLSPIVKGLVMAVAREFFQTDIVVTECHEMLPPRESAANKRPDSAAARDGREDDKSGDNDGAGDNQQQQSDDHVVLKIDRRKPAGEAALATTAHATEGGQQLDTTAPTEREARKSATSNRDGDQRDDDREQSSAVMLNIYDSLSTNASESLVNSEIMMQTFPFHVIFDREFNLVQVGKSLLRVTSLFWQRQADRSSCDSSQQRQQQPVKLGDLFGIIRPKIEFTFDAIADHTNQVFVVKTRPLVLNADFKRQTSKRLSSGSSSSSASGGGELKTATASKQQPQQRPSIVGCPFDRIASERRRRQSSDQGGDDDAVQPNEMSDAKGAASVTLESESANQKASSSREQQQQQQLDEVGDPVNHLSLRLKGQMIVLLSGARKLCLYLCSPRVDHLDQLMEAGVKLSDLALHDRARELMLMSHAHKEDREAVKKLDQASNDLKKMDTKLRQENQRTNEVLHNIFPAKIASLLSHGHQVESESFELVTCLYSDIIGFTKMCGSENVKPIDIVRLLNTLYLQFDNLTNIHGVFKVETIGDAYVVVGGLPEPLEDHADRCVKMGLDMVKVIATVRSPADQQPIQVSLSASLRLRRRRRRLALCSGLRKQAQCIA